MSADILHFVSVQNAPNRIRELRMAAGLSQQAVADRVGVAKMTISALETGKMQLTLEYMRRIASALGAATTDLMPLEDNPEALSLDERRLIEALRAAPEEQREQLHRVADVITPWRASEDGAGTHRKNRSAA